MSAAEMLMPPPPLPTDDSERKRAAFLEAVRWLIENFGLLAEGEQRGTGRIVPLRTRAATATAASAFRTKMLPYRFEMRGPRGGVTRLSPVDTWLCYPERIEVAGFRTAPDKPWPTFVEDGKFYVNLYKRPVLPEDGDPALGHALLEALLPDPIELAWFKQWLCHKLKHPEIPATAIVMIARDRFGVGRGHLFELLRRMLGREYVESIDFETLVGGNSQGVWTGWIENSILVTVNEMVAREDNRRQRRIEAFERLKELVDPAPQPRQIVRKYEHAYTAKCGPSFIFASNHGSPVMIADGDRRFSFLTNGPVQSPEFYAAFAAWVEVQANVGAFRRDIEAVDLAGFDAYAPLHTTAKDIIVDEARSTLDEAIDAALNELPGELVMREQVVAAVEAMRYANSWHLPNDWQNLVKRGVQERNHRIGVRDGPLWHLKLKQQGNNRLPVYARTAAAAKKWTKAGDVGRARTELLRNETALNRLRKYDGNLPLFSVVSSL